MVCARHLSAVNPPATANFRIKTWRSHDLLSYPCTQLRSDCLDARSVLDISADLRSLQKHARPVHSRIPATSAEAVESSARVIPSTAAAILGKPLVQLHRVEICVAQVKAHPYRLPPEGRQVRFCPPAHFRGDGVRAQRQRVGPPKPGDRFQILVENLNRNVSPAGIGVQSQMIVPQIDFAG